MFFTRKYKNKIKNIENIVLKLQNSDFYRDKDNCRFINVNDMYFKVQDHWFWNEYDSKGWEPETYDTYKNYLTKNTTYIDVGTWVGCTMFFAAEIGVNKIYGIEANDKSYEISKNNCGFNKLTKNAIISHLCITDKDNDIVSFGSTNGGETSSASSLRGNQFKVKTTKLITYLKNNKIINDDLFIKIDIEGAESLIIEDLKELSNKKDLVIYLSFHPPFWDNKEKTTKELLDVLYKFKEVRFSDNTLLNEDKLKEMCLTKEEKPSWGTPFGNFFEVIINNK